VAAIVVLTGGGIKGAVAAGRYAKDHELILLHIDHGQESASAEAKALAVLAPFWPKTRLLTIALPEPDQMPAAVRTSAGTVSVRSDESATTLGKAASVLSVRGLLPGMLSIGARIALRFGASTVVIGVSAFAPGEHIGLPGPEAGPDARREVLHAFNIMLDALLRPRTRLRVEAPLMDLTYAEVIKLGERFAIPFERTWTCDQRGLTPCGRCASCKTRERAFAEVGFVDPATAAMNPTRGAMPKAEAAAAKA
jgi:7-cyano-7-deazaguanine synthase